MKNISGPLKRPWGTRRELDFRSIMNKFFIAVFAIALSACSSVFPNKTTDPREWQTADCSGAAGWEACYAKAESRCPKGYDIANREENILSGLRTFAFTCRK